MTKIAGTVLGAMGIVLSSVVVHGQELSRYRTFELGSSVAAVVTETGVSVTQVTTLHRRPALLQELEWRPSPWTRDSAVVSTDPVDMIRFSFYEDQLYRMSIGYRRERTAGMTTADVIEAISAVYGPPILPLPQSRAAAPRVPPRPDIESGGVVAQWRDDRHSVALHRASSYGDSWELIVTGTSREALARQAEAAARKLDALEAPQREIDRQAQERERERADAEKARGVNKPVFTP